MLSILFTQFKKGLPFSLIAFLPTISFADRYGICEDGANCGGGAINGIFGLLLIIVFLGFLGFRWAGIFLFVWLAPTILAFKMGEKGYAGLWGVLGFYLSIFITAWICDFLGLDKKGESDQDGKK
jgi:hypothetical protein